MRYMTIFEEKVVGTVAIKYNDTLDLHFNIVPACLCRKEILSSFHEVSGRYSVTLCGSVPACPFFMAVYAVERKVSRFGRSFCRTVLFTDRYLFIFSEKFCIRLGYIVFGMAEIVSINLLLVSTTFN